MAKLRCSFSSMLCVAEETQGSTTRTHAFMCIRDDDDGMSVTNDIENVLAVLVEDGALRPGMCVVYRDSQGIWDEVIIDGSCHFVTFRVLREVSRDAAMVRVIDRMRGKLNG